MMTLKFFLITIGALCMDVDAFNYDESKVPDYQLPDLLKHRDGSAVESAADWTKKRRAEVLNDFEEFVYGRHLGNTESLEFDLVSADSDALEGKATRKEIDIYFAGREKRAKARMLIYLPNNVDGPVPAFIGLNFRGNHTIHEDPAISVTESWVPNDKNLGYENHRASSAPSRGKLRGRWPVEMIIERGYALATIYCGDIDPDFHDGFKNGIHPLFLANGQEKPASNEWGSIGAWSWGLSRGLDYMEKDEAIDHKRVAVIGHSRLGKTSLWAGATDERFALVISNNSGCGGAAISRRRFGETVARINTSFPHWFCDNFKKYNDKEDNIPVDQHMLIALMAPRPVYVASAEKDLWADPRGEFLSALHASPVYKLLGKDGLAAEKFPNVNEPVTSTIGYHIRTGEHDVTAYDWEQYLNFADKHVK